MQLHRASPGTGSLHQFGKGERRPQRVEHALIHGHIGRAIGLSAALAVRKEKAHRRDAQDAACGARQRNSEMLHSALVSLEAQPIREAKIPQATP